MATPEIRPGGRVVELTEPRSLRAAERPVPAEADTAFRMNLRFPDVVVRAALEGAWR